MALEKVSTPGNASPYGVEMNLGLNYRNPADGFYAGLTWGVLWPMGALNRPDQPRRGQPVAAAGRHLGPGPARLPGHQVLGRG